MQRKRALMSPEGIAFTLDYIRQHAKHINDVLLELALAKESKDENLCNAIMETFQISQRTFNKITVSWDSEPEAAPVPFRAYSLFGFPESAPSKAQKKYPEPIGTPSSPRRS